MLNEGVFFDGSDTVEQVARSYLRLKPEAAAESSKKKRRVDNPSDVTPEVELPRGLIDWASDDLIDFSDNIESLVKAGLLHLLGSFGPDASDIGFLSRDGAPIAKRDFVANQLTLLPYSRDVRADKPDSGMYAVVEASVGNGAGQPFYLLAPAGCQPKKKKESCIVSPFWNAVGATEEDTAKDDSAELRCSKHVFSVCVQASSSKNQTKGGKDLFKGGGKPPGKVQLTLPYLTNNAAVKRGATLWAHVAENIAFGQRG